MAVAEAGNNAVVGPNLIPLITLAIPGNTAAALILGAFMIHGLTPGPLFIQQYAPMLYALFTVLIISNVFTLTVGSLFVRFMRQLTEVLKRILYMAIMVFVVIGSYSFRNSLFDVMTTFFLCVFTCFLRKLEIPLLCTFVALVLGGSLRTDCSRHSRVCRKYVNFLYPFDFAYIVSFDCSCSDILD